MLTSRLLNRVLCFIAEKRLFFVGLLSGNACDHHYLLKRTGNLADARVTLLKSGEGNA